MRAPITISLENKIIETIDRTKGKNEPRSRFIEDIISEFLKKKERSFSQDQSGKEPP